MQQQLLKSNEVARILHVSRSLAYRLMKRGDIQAVHVGNAVRVRPEDLERYISDNATRWDKVVRSFYERE